MKKFKQVAIMLVAMILILPIFALAGFMVGQRVLDFTLENTFGHKHSLSQYKGKYVVLEWINHDCPFVQKHYNSGHMQSLQKIYTQRGVVWLSISSSARGKQGYYEPKEANQLTQQKRAKPTAVLRDVKGDVGKLYGATTTPHIFIINPDGILIYQGAIDNIPSTNLEDILQATNYVQTVLDAVLSGRKIDFFSTKSYGCSIKY